ncbi:ribonuclease P protein component [Arthrobacter crystallopoietes BAB-32]|uniref:Ribonuclease P protein component n=1 Tax=Arthrobacter crystallopoietes BAB-32 TaxID=1246476 RepID=N1V4L7_9MICC|nr:ribonuclease P protein component [Arthrobacter crystallopoietes]EMY34959.1 ribonuclease P protein component [Arthrobacter crystallopoietes BAB-32]
MLSSRNRMRRSADFSHTVRSGARSGRRNLVLYAAASQPDQPSAFGFIVSKAVGNAVTRNLVKRRLREIAARILEEYPRGLSVVVRALPPSGGADFSALTKDFRKAFSTVVSKAGPAVLPDEQKGSAE